MFKPKLSVLMPAYNAEKYISESIESILNQTFKDFEFIIIDDCSKDKTWKIIQDYAKKDKRIVPVKNDSNLGIAGNLNKAISISKGDFLVRMDADDWSYPTRLEKQFQYINKNSEIGVLGSAMEVCNENLKLLYIRKYHLKDIDIRKDIFKYNPFSHPSTIFRREVLLSNHYNTTLVPTEDYDLYFRIGKKYGFANLEEPLLKYRMSSTQSSSYSAKRQQYLTLYIRLKAIIEYGYKASIFDVLICILQFIIITLLPQSLKVKLFNFYRGKIKYF